MGSRRNLVREVQASLASYSPDKVGALCFLAPLASTLMARALSYLQHHVRPLFTNYLTPSLTFLLLTLTLLLILTCSIMTHPPLYSLPPSLLNFPFRPIEIACFTSPNDSSTHQPQATTQPLSHTKSSTPKRTKFSAPTSTRFSSSMLSRSVSYQDLGKPLTLPPQSPLIKAPSLSRSSSHNTYLALRSTSSRLLPTVEDLTHEEANKRFSAFIESRLATMKREVSD